MFMIPRSRDECSSSIVDTMNVFLLKSHQILFGVSRATGLPPLVGSVFQWFQMLVELSRILMLTATMLGCFCSAGVLFTMFAIFNSPGYNLNYCINTTSNSVTLSHPSDGC